MVYAVTTDSTDAYLRLLADRSRRRCLERLREAPSGTADIADLVEAALQAEGTEAASDASTTGAAAGEGGTGDPEARRRLAIRLHHVDLPKLAAQGVVEYDPEDGLVRYCPDERAEAVLEALPE